MQVVEGGGPRSRVVEGEEGRTGSRTDTSELSGT